jgi:hypothetical protein
MNVLVRRQNGLSIKVKGDDGKTELLYDGKTAMLINLDAKKYATISAPDNIDAMLQEVVDCLQLYFPLADFVAPDPVQSFLTDVTGGKVINRSGTPVLKACRCIASNRSFINVI